MNNVILSGPIAIATTGDDTIVEWFNYPSLLTDQSIYLWTDFGGTDTLVVDFETFVGPAPGVTNGLRFDGRDLVFDWYGNTLTMNNSSPDGAPSVEFFTFQVTNPNTPGTWELRTLAVTTDFSNRLPGDVVVAGTDRADVIRAKRNDADASELSIFFANNGDDTILMPRFQQSWAYAGNGADTITAKGAPNAFISGDNGDDSLTGAKGNDQIFGGKGRDVLIGGKGDDSLTGDMGSGELARNAKDTLNGGAGEDTLIGGLGKDKLSGGAADDTLTGGAANDTLKGGTGNDRLEGGDGNDRLTGGVGVDTFVLSMATTGSDVITDFNEVADQLVIGTYVGSTLTTVISDGNTLLQAINGAETSSLATLVGVELALEDISYTQTLILPF